MITECQPPKEDNVSECIPKKRDRKASSKAYYEANKEQIKAKYKTYYESNKEQLNAKKKAYKEANKEKKKLQDKAYREANKEQIKAKNKAYREANKEKKKLQDKAYREANKEQINKQKRAYYETSTKQRLKEDSLFAAKTKLRSAVNHSFRRISKNKPTDTLSLLGCSWQEAKEHFEKLFKEGMSWENHGLWHIDHIKPVASFSENELHLMNHISNLQPLWADDNWDKGSKHIINKRV